MTTHQWPVVKVVCTVNQFKDFYYFDDPKLHGHQ